MCYISCCISITNASLWVCIVEYEFNFSIIVKGFFDGMMMFSPRVYKYERLYVVKYGEAN